jgi:hypothetical protein
VLIQEIHSKLQPLHFLYIRWWLNPSKSHNIIHLLKVIEVEPKPLHQSDAYCLFISLFKVVSMCIIAQGPKEVDTYG